MLQHVRNIYNSPSFRTLGIFAGGNLLVSVIGGLGGLLQARWVANPQIVGEFNKYGIITSYFYIGLVVVHEGLMRQFPYLIGKGDSVEASKVSAAAKWWYLFATWLFTLVFLGLTAYSLAKGNFRAAVGWATQIAVVWGIVYGAYLNVMYRTSLEFKQLSYNNLITTIIGFLAIGFVKLWGYWGLALRLSINRIVFIYTHRHYLPVRVKACWDPKRLLSLIKISLPLAIPGYIRTSCLSATLCYVIFRYCGEAGLGNYGIALTFQSFALTFTAALNQMFGVKLTSKFGETEDVFSSLRYIKIPIILSFLASIFLALGLCIVIGPFVRFFLPQYVDTIPVVWILSATIPLAALELPFGIFCSALWYKSVSVIAVVQFGTCMLLILVCQKNLKMITLCSVIAEMIMVLTGFLILAHGKRRA
jgi:hypothetical protein